MRARCPHCNAVFNTDRDGIQFCPSCGQQVNVPSPQAASQPGAGPVPPPPPGAAAGPGAPGMAGGARCAYHPEAPATGTCQRCGTFICGQCERRDLSGALYCPNCSQLLGLGEGGPTPWEERANRGAIKGYFQTVKDACFAPERFWRSLDPHRSWVDALFFSWITNALATVIGLPINLLQYGSQMEALSAQRDLPAGFQNFMEVLGNPLFLALILVGTVLFYPVTFIIGAGLTHLMLMVVGGNKNGFTATARAAGYASGPLLIASIPCVGMIGTIYYLVLWVWGLSAVHRTEWWRPLVGFLILFAIIMCCAVGGAFAIGAAAAGMSR